jgi:RNA polymerase sigma factor (sigma-70 family)
VTSPERDALFARYQDLLRVIALSIIRRCPPDVDLEDLQQAGAIGLLRAIDSYDPERADTFEALCRLLIHSAMIDLLRRRDGHEQLEEREHADREAPTPQLDDQIELGQALNRLDPLARYVIDCLYWGEMAAGAVGDAIGHSERWVREIEDRALIFLGAALGGAQAGSRRALRIIIIGLRKKKS